MNYSFRPYQICTRCVMDTSDPFITFNSEGQCNHCTTLLDVKINSLKRAADPFVLNTLVEQIKIKGRNSKYDCVIGLSGGVDSSYVAMLAAKKGLRVLAVHMDNGWNSATSVENIRKLVNKFNFGYSSYVLPWTDFRQIQVAFLKASIPEVETPTDTAIQKALHTQAEKNNVKYILSGGNISSEGILPASWHYNAKDTRYSNSIMGKSSLPRSLFSTVKYGFRDEFYFKIIKNIKTVYPLDWIDYDKDSARVQLENDIDWKYYGSKHGESRFTKFIQTYYLYVKHGIDYRRATLSSEICLGLTERSNAMDILSIPPYHQDFVNSELDYLSKKLAVKREELQSIIAAPALWYSDYPNNNKILGYLYDLYRFLYSKEKMASF